jgi:hypothetical protein
VGLRDFLRERRQRAAKRRYEREKAARDEHEDFEKSRERVKGAAGLGGTLPPSGGAG